jgi:alpha-galactosidase
MTDDGESTDVSIGYIGGGSRGWALRLMNDLALTETVDGDVRLYDIDYEAAERNARFGNWVQERDDAVSDFTYTAYRDRAEALDGADIVLCSTQPDPAKTRVPELKAIEEYDHYHAAAGGSVGPGGIFRAMREIPNYRDIAAAIREHCPDAWVFNFTNPMTMLTRTLYKEYPDINAIGLCHEVFGGQHWLASLVENHWDVEAPARDEIHVNVKGINHFTWVDEATWNGRDLFPLVDAELEAHDELPKFEAGSMADDEGLVKGREITLDLYRRYGVLPLVADRHLPEFAPQYLRVDDPDELHRWGIQQTPFSFYLDSWTDTPQELEAYMNGEEAFDLEQSGEIMIDLIQALEGDQPLTTNVNHPNVGQMPDIREDAVVETNARLTEGGIKPITAGTLPEPVREQVRRHVSTQETLVEAAFAGDVDLAFQAFRNDPQLLAFDPETCVAMFQDLVETSRSYLEDNWNLADAAVLAADRNAIEH